MIVKSIIAGTVLSLMAGGVVYFGTDVEAENAGETALSGHPHTEKTPADTKITAKKVTVKKASSIPEKLVEAEPKPQKKWLDQYLKTEAPKTETITTKTVTTEETVEIDDDGHETGNGASAKDTGKFVVDEDKAIEVELFTEDEIEKGTGKKTVDVQVMKAADGITTIETETIDMGDGKVMKIVKKTQSATRGHKKDGHRKMRIKVLTDEDFDGDVNSQTLKMGDGKIIKIITKKSIGDLMHEAKHKDISGTVKTVMEQAEKINMPELRDRAYLDLVSYALDHGDYGVANTALEKINQVELRDTARNRIAIAYAKDGQADAAFAIMEDIEVEALRDVMRLQVIEAMIVPEELPKDMR
jgi:hypothetical protein